MMNQYLDEREQEPALLFQRAENLFESYFDIEISYIVGVGEHG
jgi:hypothetical protein